MMGIPTTSQVGFPANAYAGVLWENPSREPRPCHLRAGGPQIHLNPGVVDGNLTMDATANVADTLPGRIKQRLADTGQTMRGVSLAIGAHAGYIRDLMDPDRFNVPSATRLQALANQLETTTEYLLGRVTSPDQVRSEVGVYETKLDFHGPFPDLPGIPLVGTGDCADLEVCDESGQMVEIERASFDPDFTVRMIDRPPALRGAREIYAIYFVGSSMEPRFEPGEVGIVDPRRPVGAGDYVLVQLNDGESRDVSSVLVKRLVRQNSKQLVLEQFNPPRTFVVPRARVARVHRIMRQTDLLF